MQVVFAVTAIFILFALGGCASNAQLQQMHEAEIAKIDAARSNAVTSIKNVHSAVTPADLEKCRTILRGKWHIFGGSYRVDGPLVPDVKYTCVTKRPKSWFDTAEPVSAAFVTKVTYITASGSESFKTIGFCTFEIKNGKVADISGEIGHRKGHVHNPCHRV